MSSKREQRKRGKKTLAQWHHQINHPLLNPGDDNLQQNETSTKITWWSWIVVMWDLAYALLELKWCLVSASQTYREGYLASFLPALLFAYSNPVSLELTTSEHTKLSLLEDCETSRSLFFSLLLLQSSSFSTHLRGVGSGAVYISRSFSTMWLDVGKPLRGIKVVPWRNSGQKPLFTVPWRMPHFRVRAYYCSPEPLCLF